MMLLKKELLIIQEVNFSCEITFDTLKNFAHFTVRYTNNVLSFIYFSSQHHQHYHHHHHQVSDNSKQEEEY